MARSPRLLVPGLVALGFFLVHAGNHLLFRDRPENLLWACQLGGLLVALGLLTRSANLNALGVLWLSVGTPLWLIGLAIGKTTFVVTSPLTHVGNLLLGVHGARLLGVPRRSWLKAWVALAVLHTLSRWIVPQDRNVNLVRKTWRGFETLFPTHEVFLFVVACLCLAAFAAVEYGLRRYSRGPHAQEVGHDDA